MPVTICIIFNVPKQTAVTSFLNGTAQKHKSTPP